MLMAGLDQVKGPHWSQILGLYGPNGTVNNALAERNQVQLKDKARNLKLFFLKSDIEVPYYLQSVTGELKTRAPSQAARREAEERARLSGDDEQARLSGIMMLANGMKQSSVPVDAENSLSSVHSFDSQDGSEVFQVVEEDQEDRRDSQVQQEQVLMDTLVAATANDQGNREATQKSTGVTSVVN